MSPAPGVHGSKVIVPSVVNIHCLSLFYLVVPLHHCEYGSYKESSLIDEAVDEESGTRDP